MSKNWGVLRITLSRVAILAARRNSLALIILKGAIEENRRIIDINARRLLVVQLGVKLDNNHLYAR